MKRTVEEVDSTNTEVEVAGFFWKCNNENDWLQPHIAAAGHQVLSPVHLLLTQTKDTVYHNVKPGETILEFQ